MNNPQMIEKMPNVFQVGGVPIKVWTDLAGVEPQALNQLGNISRIPGLFHHLAVMPDVHLGKGATVGSVVATERMVIPSAVGVDIGCGMYAMNTGLSASILDGKLPAIRSALEACIPVGREQHVSPVPLAVTWLRWEQFDTLPEKVQDRKSKAMCQIGTLGGGNHFIELCLDTTDTVWIMLHSGSRNIGKEIAEVHINEAKDLLKRYFIKLDDPDLAYLVEGSPEFAAYWRDLQWAQAYAKRNREAMAWQTRVILGLELGQNVPIVPILEVDCHHNYAEREHHFGRDVIVTRKGAVRARVSDMGIIPGSMGTKSYIVRGKGHADSFCSCSHGAGRRMSRSEAKRIFTLDDVAAQTAGVECRKDAGIIDEAPGAYKDIDQVMAFQSDLVEIVATLKQVLVVKG